MTLSTSQKYAAKMKTVTMTTVVVDCTSARDGVDHLAHLAAHVLQEAAECAPAVTSAAAIPVLVCCSATATVLAITLPQSSLLLTSYCSPACG